jgi:hypothetical protein
MTLTHEEGDTIIVQHMTNIKASKSLVVAYVTDMFILPFNFVHHGDIPSYV